MSETRRALLTIIEQPDLMQTIKTLPAPVLHKLVVHVGLEDAHDLIALATREQLQLILDEDLWSNSKPGQAERFDPTRFGVWLEVMLELGSHFAAERVAEMDPDLITAAILHHIIVLDRGALDLEAFTVGVPSDDDLATDKALESNLTYEIDGFLLVARRHDAWDAIITILVELSTHHHDFVIRLLERCVHISMDQVEDSGGLQHALSLSEQLEEDLAADREARRAKAGHVEPRAAKAFLQLCMSTPLDTKNSLPIDPMTRAYFREFEPSDLIESKLPFDLLTALIDNDESTKKAQKRIGLSNEHWPLSLAIDEEKDDALRTRCVEELAYLANVILAACVREDKQRFRPNEAAEAALAYANRGFEHLKTSLHEVNIVTLFRIGWHLAHEVANPSIDHEVTKSPSKSEWGARTK